MKNTIRVERAKSEKNILRAIREAGKGKQASTFVVTRTPNVSLDLPTVFGDRFWGNPQFQWIDKIVILQDGTIKVIARPVRGFGGFEGIKEQRKLNK